MVLWQVWDKDAFKLKAVLTGHTGSILALEYAPEKHWLFSASGIFSSSSAAFTLALIRLTRRQYDPCTLLQFYKDPCFTDDTQVWNTRNCYSLHILHPHLDTDSGDLFSLIWSPQLQTLYFGCQNTSLQWFSFPLITPELLSISPSLDVHSSSGTSTPPSRKAHKFFDSYPQYTRRPADLNARNPTCASCAISTTPPSASSPRSRTPPDPCVQSDVVQPLLSVFQVPPENVIYSAHYGYIYCMALLPSHRDGSDDFTFEMDQDRPLQLVTGSGDSMVKVRRFRQTYGLDMLTGVDRSFGSSQRSPQRVPLGSSTRLIVVSAQSSHSQYAEIPFSQAAKMVWLKSGISKRTHLFAPYLSWR